MRRQESFFRNALKRKINRSPLMFNFPLEREQALQSPLIGVSFRVRLSRDFSRLSQIESLPCRLFFPLERPTSRFSLLHQEIKTKLLCWSTISEHIFTTLNNNLISGPILRVKSAVITEGSSLARRVVSLLVIQGTLLQFVPLHPGV